MNKIVSHSNKFLEETKTVTRQTVISEGQGGH